MEECLKHYFLDFLSVFIIEAKNALQDFQFSRIFYGLGTKSKMIDVEGIPSYLKNFALYLKILFLR